MRAYIDKCNLIRIESREHVNKVLLNGYPGKLERISNEVSYFRVEKNLDLKKDLVLYVNDYAIPIEIGLITQIDDFEKKYRYDGPLGYVYHKNKTEFYIWSPVAKELILVLDGKEYKMIDKGDYWYQEIKGNFHEKPYYYKVRTSTYFEKVVDPWAKAGTNEYSYVIDFSKTEKTIPSKLDFNDKLEAIIYEGHIRDLTIDLDVENKGLYLGLTENSEKLNMTPLEYIKSLGITHLQLQPVQDFLGVDDKNKDKLYNWGYNPDHYFVLEGWYSKDPNNPLSRINEFKKLVNSIHKTGMSVNLDVVYNHVYDYQNFSFNKLIPNYLYHFHEDGEIWESSGCKNDIATNRYMARRLIIDSIEFLVKEYKIDGFRFDLMGLMDIETMELIRLKLATINPNIMLYGEGWNIPCALDAEEAANMANQKQFKSYAHFNDQFRDLIKNYAKGDNSNIRLVRKSILGSSNIFDFSHQSINYVECHDNYTYIDYLSLDQSLTDESKKAFSDLATHLVIISQGIPFIHAGQEFYRSKKGVENSYKSPDSINKLEWHIEYESVSKLKELIKLRKKYKAYIDPDLKEVVEKDGYLVYTIKKDNYELIHYIQNNFNEQSIEIAGMEQVFESKKTVKETLNKLKTCKPGVYIFKKQ